MKTRRIWTDIAKGYVTPPPQSETHDDDNYNARIDGLPYQRSVSRRVTDRTIAANLNQYSTAELMHEVSTRQIRLGEPEYSVVGGTHTFDPDLEMTSDQLRTLEQFFFQATHSMDAGRLRRTVDQLSSENRRKLFAAVIFARHRNSEGVQRRNQTWQRGDMVRAITNDGADINGALLGGGKTAKILQLSRGSSLPLDCQWHTLERLSSHTVRLVANAWDTKTFRIDADDEARMLAIYPPTYT